MLSNKFFPYSSMQEINLDWILTKVKNILRFVPDDGSVGQILRRTAHGAEWSNEQGGGGAVDSVNGQTGTVVLTASDVGALPDTYTAPVDSVNGQTGTVVLSIPTDTGDLTNGAGYVTAAGAAAAAPVQSVNGQTGTVSLTIPTDTGDLTNGAGFVTAAGAAAAAPVQSVNGQTGNVTIPYLDFQMITVEYQYSLSGNGTTSTNFKTLVDGLMPAGYQYFCYCGFASNNATVFPINIFYGDSSYSFYIKNISSAAASGTFRVYVLVVK